MDAETIFLFDSFHPFFASKYCLTECELSFIYNSFLYSSETVDFVCKRLSLGRTRFYSIFASVKSKLRLPENSGLTDVCLFYLSEFFLFLVSRIFP